MSLRDDINVLVEDLLPADARKWCEERTTRKILHDALWGTFELNRQEIAILDTPLLQRLRFIHQTGAVHFTYPSARHTRFEHVLGVMHQAGRMCLALRDRPNENRFDKAFELQVRFAGLLHDIGHGPFSHTSEQYFSKFEDIAEIRGEDYFKDSGAGEVLSCLLIQSDRFRELVRVINDLCHTDLNIDVAANMITGNMPDDQIYKSEFVHGPFDADKLDYMHRDGLFSGLRMHVDLDRLYASIEVTTGSEDYGEGVQTLTRLAGTMAGTSPLTQILFNKMLLFTGMYHHHKVRAVDCMLWSIFELAETTHSTLGGVELNGTVDFLKLTDDRVLCEELTNNDEVKRIIQKIRRRDLWKRALVISRNTVTPEMYDTEARGERNPLLDYISLSKNKPESIARRREIAGLICEEAGNPCGKHEVWLDIPKQPSMSESERMWIKVKGIDKHVTLGDYLPIQQWVELYGFHKWQSHVFCPPAVRSKINTAAQTVLQKELGLEFTNLATEHANIDR